MTTKEGTRTVYYCDIPAGERKLSVCINEAHAFSSKDELISTMTERFYKSLEPGSS